MSLDLAEKLATAPIDLLTAVVPACCRTRNSVELSYISYGAFQSVIVSRDT